MLILNNILPESIKPTGSDWECALPKVFFEGREEFRPDYKKNSLSYKSWWSEQIRRSKEGLEYNGIKVTGEYYSFLNFGKIKIHKENADKTFNYPFYSSKDHELFELIDIAKKLALGIMLITGRGYGKSYVAAWQVIHRYTFYPHSESIVSASDDLAVDPLWEKIEMYLNAIDAELFHNQDGSSTKKKVKSGTKIKDEDGHERIVGFHSTIKKVVYDGKVGKTRGPRPDIHLFEEVGKWKGLKETYRVASQGWRVGARFKCLPFLLGTGGEMATGLSEDAKEMFFDPETYDLLALPNIYDEEGGNNGYGNRGRKKISVFMPTYVKYGEFYEEKGDVLILGEKAGHVKAGGICDQVNAKKFEDSIRKRKEKDQELYDQHIQEYPYTPKEAFMLSTSTPFSKYLKDRYYILTVDRRSNPTLIGELHDTGKKDKNGQKIIEFERTNNGKFQIAEKPIFDSKGRHYNKLYVSGCDSYDQDKAETTDSEGSIMIYKRMLNAESTNNLFVAGYTDRPSEADDFYKNTLLLNQYYNSKMLVEHTKIGIINYYLNNNSEKFLCKKPTIIYKQAVKNPKAVYKYGLQMPAQIKIWLIDRMKTWLKNYADHLIMIDQVDDLIHFHRDSNKFDISIASMLAVAQDWEWNEAKVTTSGKKETKRKFGQWKTVNGILTYVE